VPQVKDIISPMTAESSVWPPHGTQSHAVWTSETLEVVSSRGAERAPKKDSESVNTDVISQRGLVMCGTHRHVANMLAPCPTLRTTGERATSE
jgi:hypothetical protein